MNRLRSILIPVLFVLCVISAIMMIIVLFKLPQENAVFVVPGFDGGTVKGTPEPPQELGWAEIYQYGIDYRVSICGNIIVKENTADIYFLNAEKNTVWLKLRIMDEQNSIICETGLIRPGEYIKSVSFNNEIYNGEKIKLKIMAYEPDTYYSAGSIVLNTNIHRGE